MSDKISAQQELLKELYNYSANIIPGTETLITELRHNRQTDTDELFNLVIQGINWEIEVFNNCENLINEKEQKIDKAKMASAVGRLGKVLQEKDDIKLAASLEVDFLPFLKTMKNVAETMNV
ncbi:hypothetical protein KQI72_04870 [Eubacterium sp. MSJ-21]|jgi:hypothetical protein|nr:hypothetical protein [Eubacterium sp. MSJ-21]